MKRLFTFAVAALVASAPLAAAKHGLKGTIDLLASLSNPSFLCYNPVDNKVYCSQVGGGEWGVAVIDAGLEAYLTKVNTGGMAPGELVYAGTPGRVFTHDNGTTLWAINGASNALDTSVMVGQGESDLAYNQAQDKVYTSDAIMNGLQIYNSSTLAPLGSNADVRGNLLYVEALGKLFGIANGRIYGIDGISNAVIDSSDVINAQASSQMVYNPTNQKLYVVITGQNEVRTIDAATTTADSTFMFGLAITGIEYCPRDSAVYVSTWGIAKGGKQSPSDLYAIQPNDSLITYPLEDGIQDMVYNPVDSLLYLLCTNAPGKMMWLFDPAQHVVSESVDLAGSGDYRDLVVDAQGDVYTADYASGMVYAVGQVPNTMWRSNPAANPGSWFYGLDWEICTDGSGGTWAQNTNDALFPTAADSTILVQAGDTMQVIMQPLAVDQLTVDGTLYHFESVLTVNDGPGVDLVVHGVFDQSTMTCYEQPPTSQWVYGPGSLHNYRGDGDSIPIAAWDSASVLDVRIDNAMSFKGGIGQSFGTIDWNWSSSFGFTIATEPGFTARQLNINSTGGVSPLRICSNLVPEVTLGGLAIGSGGDVLLGSGGVKKLTIDGDLEMLNSPPLALYDAGNPGICTLRVRGNYTYMIAKGGKGWAGPSGPDSAAVIFDGGGVHDYLTGGDITGGFVDIIVEPGNTLNAGNGPVGLGSQGRFVLMPGAFLSFGDALGAWVSADSGCIRNTGPRVFGPNAGFIINEGTGPGVAGDAVAGDVSMLHAGNSFGTTLLANVAVNDSLLLQGPLDFGDTLTLNGALQPMGGVLGYKNSAVLRIAPGAGDVVLPVMSSDTLGTLSIERPATILLAGDFQLGRRLDLTAGVLDINTNSFILGDSILITRTPGGSLVNGTPSFQGTANLIYGGGTITAGLELPASNLAIKRFTVQSPADTVIVDRDSLGITERLSVPGGLRFNGKYFYFFGDIDTIGGVGWLQLADTCNASIFKSGPPLYLPAITGGRLSLDVSPGGSIMRGDITLSRALAINTGPLTVGPHTLTVGDSLPMPGAINTGVSSSLVFNGQPVDYALPSSVDSLRNLTWDRNAVLSTSSGSVILYDSLQLLQGTSTASIMTQGGVTIVRGRGSFTSGLAPQGAVNLLYRSHGGGKITMGAENPGIPTFLANLTIGGDASIADTVGMAGNVYATFAALNLESGVFCIDSATLSLDNMAINVAAGQLLADSTSNMVFYSGTYALPATISRLNSLSIDAADLNLPGIVTIDGIYTQGRGHLLSGGLQYGPFATLAYTNNTVGDTTSDAEYPATNGPRNLTAGTALPLFLHAGRTVPGTLTLNGTLNTGAGAITMDTAGTVVPGAGFVEGRLAKLVPLAADTVITYELGTAAGGSSPVTVQAYNNTAPAQVTAGITGGVYPLANDTTACLRKYWSFTGPGLAADSCLITLGYLATDFNPPSFTEMADESTLVVGRHDNVTPGWQLPTPALRNIFGTSDGGSVAIRHAGNFSESPDFTLGRDSLSLTLPAADTTGPSVMTTVPVNGATGSALNAAVSVSFTEPIDTALFTYGFNPNPGGLTVGWTPDSLQATIGHADLAPLTTYTVSVLSAPDTAGNPLDTTVVPRSWSFTTGAAPDTTGPSVMATVPSNGATGSALNTVVSVSFTEPIDTALFTYGFNPDPGGLTVGWTPDSLQATIGHADLAPLTTYTVSVLSAPDTAGNPLDTTVVPRSWSFTTGAAPDTAGPSILATVPVNGATGSAFNAAVSVSFTEAIDTSLFTYSVNPNPGGLTVGWTPDSLQATIGHADLAPLTTYTVSVLSAPDTAGNPLDTTVVPRSWSFTTGAAPDTVPPAAPESLQIYGFNPSYWLSGATASVPVGWVNPADSTAILRAYYKTYSPPVDSADFTDSLFMVGGVRDTFFLAVDTLNGVMPVYLWLKDGAGNASHLNRGSITARRDTVAPANAMVKTFAADTTVATTFAVNWSPGTDALSGIQAWRVLSRIDTSAVWDTLAPFSNDTTISLAGALPGHRYYFEAAACDSAYNFEDFTGTEEASIFVAQPAVDTIPPAIVSASPANGATGVTVNAAVSILFSEPIQSSLFGFTITPDPGGLSAGWSADSTAVTIGHAPFATATGYMVTVTSAPDTMGLPLSGANSFGFTTADTSAPAIVSTTPADGATGAAVGAPMTVTFSEAMDIGAFAYTVAPDPGGLSAAWSADSLTMTISHSPFGYLTAYTVTIDTARDAAGNPLAGPAGFGFTTGPAPDTARPYVSLTVPGAGQTIVSLGQQVIITFSEVVDTASLRFACSPDPGSWSRAWSGAQTVTLSHAPFAENTTYACSVDSVADLAGNTIDTTSTVNLPWSFTTTGMTTLATGWPGGVWKLWSSPLPPQDSSALAVLGDDLGASSDTTWRLVGYKPNSGYVERPSIAPGYGYWLATARNATIDAQGLPLSGTHTTALDSGWNIVGDPFNAAVAVPGLRVRWNDGVPHDLYYGDSLVNGVLRQMMWNYADNSADLVNNGWWDSLSPYRAGDSLRPWQGYAVYAVQPCSLVSERWAKTKVGAAPPERAVAWQLELSAAMGPWADRGLKLGVSPQASLGYDRLDAEKPPLVSDDLSMFIPHHDWGQGPCRSYLHDFRPPGTEHQWLLTVAAAGRAPVQVDFSLAGALEPGYDLYIVNSSLGQAQRVSGSGMVQLSGGGDLTVVYTSRGLPELNLKPLAFGLTRIQPNPFRGRTVISYQLDRPGRVSLKVYNSLGQLAATLVESHREAGFHIAAWDGGRTAAGVYLIRLESEGRSRVTKTVKLK